MPNDVADWKRVSARPPAELGFVNNNPNPNTVQFTLPSDIQALVLTFIVGRTSAVHLKVAWDSSGGPVSVVPLELFSFSQDIYVIPITPMIRDANLDAVNKINVTVQGPSPTGVIVEVTALFEANPLWLQVFPTPQLAPNQFPKTVLLTLAALTAQWVIQSVANVQITLFNIVVMRYNPSAAGDDFQIGYSAALPPNGSAPPNAEILVDSTQTAASGAGPMFTLPLAGVQLPRGSGLWADTSLSAIANLWLLVEYSLS